MMKVRKDILDAVWCAAAEIHGAIKQYEESDSVCKTLDLADIDSNALIIKILIDSIYADNKGVE